MELAVEPPGNERVMHISGQIRYLDLEGGLYVIETPDGVRFSPTNLPAAFQRDGLAVEADALPRDDAMSIGMVAPLVELLRIREPADATPSAPELAGTSWLLEDLAGTGVLDRVQSTLVFTSEGEVSGNAACNRFRGSWRKEGDGVRFGPLATTRMKCVEAVMHQEQRYLAALQDTRRIARQGPFLYLYPAGQTSPLRFVGLDKIEAPGE